MKGLIAMNNYIIRMLIGCVLPLLLIFLLPVFGVSSTLPMTILIILMLGCHLLMGHRHGEAAPGDEERQIRPSSSIRDRRSYE